MMDWIKASRGVLTVLEDSDGDLPDLIWRTIDAVVTYSERDYFVRSESRVTTEPIAEEDWTWAEDWELEWPKQD
jgi:hypothetical protein